MFKLVLEKAEGPEIILPSAGSWKKQESSRKTSISALLTMPKPLTVPFLGRFSDLTLHQSQLLYARRSPSWATTPSSHHLWQHSPSREPVNPPAPGGGRRMTQFNTLINPAQLLCKQSQGKEAGLHCDSPANTVNTHKTRAGLTCRQP